MTKSRTFTFLGTGTSAGVPMLGCDCAGCRSTDPRNQRYRCAVLLRLPRGNVVIDTPPELRLQLLRAKVALAHAVLYTHYHADHLFGLDDVRPFSYRLGGTMPLYCTEEVERVIRTSYAYAFDEETDPNLRGYVPQLRFKRIGNDPFQVLEQQVVPIPLVHARYHVLGFRFDDVAYCTDVSEIPEDSWRRLEGLRILVLDALRHTPHPAHFNVEQALEVIQRLKPERAYLTHMSHDLEHEATNRSLPSGVELAYDGLEFSF
jgi:phosphoribosyl 1,2-cyclic phosphate phosphodiesterase